MHRAAERYKYVRGRKRVWQCNMRTRGMRTNQKENESISNEKKKNEEETGEGKKEEQEKKKEVEEMKR
jgi:hypothetical protein